MQKKTITAQVIPYLVDRGAKDPKFRFTSEQVRLACKIPVAEAAALNVYMGKLARNGNIRNVGLWEGEHTFEYIDCTQVRYKTNRPGYRSQGITGRPLSDTMQTLIDNVPAEISGHEMAALLHKIAEQCEHLERIQLSSIPAEELFAEMQRRIVEPR